MGIGQLKSKLIDNPSQLKAKLIDNPSQFDVLRVSFKLANRVNSQFVSKHFHHSLAGCSGVHL